MLINILLLSRVCVKSYFTLIATPLDFSSVQSLSCVWFFATPWTAARQASLSITNSWSLPRLMSIELVMPSNPLILCRPLLLVPSILPSIRVQISQLYTLGGQSIGVSASASVLPVNIQDCSPLGWTGWISLPSQGLLRYRYKLALCPVQSASAAVKFLVYPSSTPFLLGDHKFVFHVFESVSVL